NEAVILCTKRPCADLTLPQSFTSLIKDYEYSGLNAIHLLEFDRLDDEASTAATDSVCTTFRYADLVNERVKCVLESRDIGILAVNSVVSVSIPLCECFVGEFIAD